LKIEVIGQGQEFGLWKASIVTRLMWRDLDHRSKVVCPVVHSGQRNYTALQSNGGLTNRLRFIYVWLMSRCSRFTYVFRGLRRIAHLPRAGGGSVDVDRLMERLSEIALVDALSLPLAARRPSVCLSVVILYPDISPVCHAHVARRRNRLLPNITN